MRGQLLLDAAMGTRLIVQGLDLATDDPCLWNLTRPDAVREIHRWDVATGAEAVFTNTFGANRTWLARFGRERDCTRINRTAVALARAAVGPGGFVVGSIGPTVTDEAAIRAQADVLRDAGVDALALETFRFEQAIQALDWLGYDDLPILVGLFTWPEPIADHANRLFEAGATSVGANCFADLAWAHRFLDVIEDQGDLIGWLKPASSVPGGPALSLADFAILAERMAQLKTGLLGGCCGTTEQHLAAIRAAWNRDNLLVKRAPGW